jgi:thiol-disulfide isomerase/thioredoxin
MLTRLVLAAMTGTVLLHGQPAMPQSLADADRLETYLQTSPEDLTARSRLLIYYTNPTMSVPPDRIKAALREHVVWIIQHHPEHAMLQMTWAAIAREGRRTADAEAYDAADQAWRKQLAAPSPAPGVYANAVWFYRFTNPEFARQISADGLKAHPDHGGVGIAAGMLHAYAILHAKGDDQFGRVGVFDDSPQGLERERQARRELESATKPAVIGGTGIYLQQALFALDQSRRTARIPEITEVAEKLLKQTLAMEPRNPRWTSSLSSLYSYQATREPDKKQKVALLQKAVDSADEVSRLSPLESLASTKFEVGDYASAAATARDLLSLAAKYTENWAYGNAVHRGNILLGRIALHDGDQAEAARRLLVAGGIKGSPQLISFGPDWQLASELLANGDRDIVLQYIALCRKFWTSGAGRLDTWEAAIKAGGVPNFNGRPELAKPDLAGRVAPAFKLPLLKGSELSLEQLRGKIVLVDFWATWCAPCRAEMPTFEKLHLELKDKDVAILAVDIGEGTDLVGEFIAKEKYTFPVLLSEGTDITKDYGVNAYPTLVSVDREGKVVDYLIGGRDEGALREVIARARAGAGAPVASKLLVVAPSSGIPAPKLLSPSAGASFDHFPRVTTLVWSPVEGASGYVVEWDFYDGGQWAGDRTGILAKERVADPVHTMSFVGAQRGRWRVTTLDAKGNLGAPSAWREFVYTR